MANKNSSRRNQKPFSVNHYLAALKSARKAFERGEILGQKRVDELLAAFNKLSEKLKPKIKPDLQAIGIKF